MHRREFIGALAAAPLAAQTGIPQWDAEGQRQRRELIYKLHRRSVGPLYSDQGKWIAQSHKPGQREQFWSCLSLLSGDETREKGNALAIEAVNMHPKGGSAFEHMGAMLLLLKSEKYLTPQARSTLREYVQRAVPAHGTIRFMGFNDNFPAMDTWVTVLGGELLDNASIRRKGREGLEALAELFERRGLLSEHTSPTYTPLTLICYADIVELSRDPDVARLAHKLEHRIWLDLATHFHAPTNVLAGPHSRAYSVDSAGHPHQVNMLLYQAFGDRFWMTPPTHFYPPVEGQVVHHQGDAPFMQTSNALFAAFTTHPSAEIAKLMFDKPFPYRVVGTAEYGNAVEPIMIRGEDPNGPFTRSEDVFEYAAGEVVTTTYLTEDYAMGSGTSQFHNGSQCDAFFVNYRRKAPAKSLKDIATIYCRYKTNDRRPGVPEGNPVHPEWGLSTDSLQDEGRVRVIQKEGTALAVYQAKGQILDQYRSLCLSIIVTTGYGKPKRILVGEKDLNGQLPFDSATPEIIWMEDELVYAAFRPLLLSNHGRKAAVRVEEQAGYLTISLYNYQGPPKRFSRKDLCATMNGFVAELGSRKEHGSFEAFRQKVLKGTVRDEVVSNQRRTRYTRDGVNLELSHSVYYGGLKYALIDRRPQAKPLLEAPGVKL